jgi:hypothetical protein
MRIIHIMVAFLVLFLISCESDNNKDEGKVKYSDYLISSASEQPDSVIGGPDTYGYVKFKIVETSGLRFKNGDLKYRMIIRDNGVVFRDAELSFNTNQFDLFGDYVVVLGFDFGNNNFAINVKTVQITFDPDYEIKEGLESNNTVILPIYQQQPSIGG